MDEDKEILLADVNAVRLKMNVLQTMCYKSLRADKQAFHD